MQDGIAARGLWESFFVHDRGTESPLSMEICNNHQRMECCKGSKAGFGILQQQHGSSDGGNRNEWLYI